VPWEQLVAIISSDALQEPELLQGSTDEASNNSSKQPQVRLAVPTTLSTATWLHSAHNHCIHLLLLRLCLVNSLMHVDDESEPTGVDCLGVTDRFVIAICVLFACANHCPLPADPVLQLVEVNTGGSVYFLFFRFRREQQQQHHRQLRKHLHRQQQPATTGTKFESTECYTCTASAAAAAAAAAAPLQGHHWSQQPYDGYSSFREGVAVPQSRLQQASYAG